MDTRLKIVLSIILQIVHLCLAGGLLMLGFVVFIFTAPLFDLLGSGDRSILPNGVFQNVTTKDPGVRSTLSWFIDLPVFVLTVCYFLSVVWMKCRGLWSWLMTTCMLITLTLFVIINSAITRDTLDWRYFKTRTLTIFLDILVLSFAWTVTVVILLHIRDWFPFKIKKSLSGGKGERVLLVLWNFVAFYLVLSLCLLTWYSRLYTSWACITDTEDILLMCQFTNQIQCYRCEAAYNCADLDQCVTGDPDPYHCLAPLYTITPKSALCVFNYNIGPFTFVSVFAYVGGLYFFLRTTLNAFIKCIRVVIFISYKYTKRLTGKFNPSAPTDADQLPLHVAQAENDKPDKSRVSLLASLPKDYLGFSTTLRDHTTINPA